MKRLFAVLLVVLAATAMSCGSTGTVALTPQRVAEIKIGAHVLAAGYSAWQCHEAAKCTQQMKDISDSIDTLVDDLTAGATVSDEEHQAVRDHLVELLVGAGVAKNDAKILVDGIANLVLTKLGKPASWSDVSAWRAAPQAGALRTAPRAMRPAI